MLEFCYLLIDSQHSQYDLQTTASSGHNFYIEQINNLIFSIDVSRYIIIFIVVQFLISSLLRSMFAESRAVFSSEGPERLNKLRFEVESKAGTLICRLS